MSHKDKIKFNSVYAISKPITKGLTKLNSVAFSPQVNYTHRATAACRRS
jgi:hypothetical protein